MRRIFHFFLLVATWPWTGAAVFANGYQMTAEEVAPGVYAVITPTRELPNPLNRGWNSNSAFVVTREGVLLIDSGSSQAIGESLRSVIAGVTTEPVRWIVNTHSHGDHWLGNAAFADSVETIYATAVVSRTIGSEWRTWVDRFNEMTGGATGESRLLAPSTNVDSRTTLELGGREVVLFPSRDSHSPGDLIVWLPHERVLAAGDVVYSDRMPSTFDANVSNWIGMLDELVELDPAVVVPGHGVVTDIDGLRRLRELLAALWDAVAARYEEGMTDFEMVPHVVKDLSRFDAHFPGLQDKIARDLSYVYLQVEEASF